MADSGFRAKNPAGGYLKTMTPEQRLELARIRAAQRADWANVDLKQDWADKDFMLQCARQAGIKVLPPRAEPATDKRLRRFARKMGIKQADLQALIGFSTLAEFIESNPHHPLWALICHLAETI